MIGLLIFTQQSIKWAQNTLSIPSNHTEHYIYIKHFDYNKYSCIKHIIFGYTLF